MYQHKKYCKSLLQSIRLLLVFRFESYHTVERIGIDSYIHYLYEQEIHNHILVEETALASFEHMADRLAQRVASGKYFASLFLTMISIESVYLDESVNQTCRRLYDDWQKLYADHLVRFGFSEEESVPKAQAIFALIHGSMISSWIKRDPADLMMAKKALRGIIGER